MKKACIANFETPTQRMVGEEAINVAGASGINNNTNHTQWFALVAV